MGQRLIGAAHYAEADMPFAPLHECRNDGVEWTLAAAVRWDAPDRA